MTEPPTETDPHRAEALRWLAKATDDIAAAKILLAAEPSLLEPAAYHCQQAAEKLMKGLLMDGKVPVPRSHDLSYLASLVGSVNRHMHDAAAAVSDLTIWGTAVRYPQLDEFILTKDDVHGALLRLASFEAAVRSILLPTT